MKMILLLVALSLSLTTVVPTITAKKASSSPQNRPRDERLWQRALAIHRRAIVIDTHNEIRKIVKAVDPPPAYGFIHKNNPESRFLRFVAAVLEDGADMIDPAFKDSFKRPLLTEFEAEALYYLALGLSNWAIARKCSLSLRGVESRLATLYEKLFVAVGEGTEQEVYEKLAYNIRTRAFFEALRRGLLNSDELEKASQDLEAWLAKDQKRFAEEQKREATTKKR